MDGSEWSGRSSSETSEYLERLKKSLVEAIDAHKAVLARNYCNDILLCGGVFHREMVAPHIKHEIAIDHFINHIGETAAHLNTLSTQGFSTPDLGYSDRNNHAFRLDSGTTKIYSLRCDSLIIYDGRVAAAMCMLVLKWWCSLNETDKGHYDNRMPDALRFSYDQSNTHRQPDIRLAGASLLNGLKVGNQRVKENIPASWLIEESLRRDEKRNGRASNFSLIDNKSERLRAVEAALFMVGYSIDGM